MNATRALGFAGLFPGQLSERPGMGEALALRYRFVSDFFESVSARSGVEIGATFFGEGSSSLHDNRPAQVGVFAVSIAVLDVLEFEFGLRPDAVAGYSLGTYAAFVAAGSLERWQALDVLLEAERLLAEDPVDGGMGYVIGLTRPALEELLRSLCSDTERLSIGNANAAQQFVITGDAELVAAAIERARPVALRAEILPLSWPMHSIRLTPVSERLSRYIERQIRVEKPTNSALFAPMFGRRVESAAEASQVLGGQIASPSRWDAVLHGMRESGLDRFAEIGPGDILTRLLRWTVRGGRGSSLQDPSSITAFVADGMAAAKSPSPEERV